MAKVQISVPLDLDHVEVLKVEFEGETIHIQVESTLKYARCVFLIINKGPPSILFSAEIPIQL